MGQLRQGILDLTNQGQEGQQHPDGGAGMHMDGVMMDGTGAAAFGVGDGGYAGQNAFGGAYPNAAPAPQHGAGGYGGYAASPRGAGGFMGGAGPGGGRSPAYGAASGANGGSAAWQEDEW